MLQVFPCLEATFFIFVIENQDEDFLGCTYPQITLLLNELSSFSFMQIHKQLHFVCCCLLSVTVKHFQLIFPKPHTYIFNNLIYIKGRTIIYNIYWVSDFCLTPCVELHKNFLGTILWNVNYCDHFIGQRLRFWEMSKLSKTMLVAQPGPTSHWPQHPYLSHIILSFPLRMTFFPHFPLTVHITTFRNTLGIV